MRNHPAALVGRHILLLDSPRNRSLSVRRITYDAHQGRLPG
jgi:hypothetical protein